MSTSTATMTDPKVQPTPDTHFPKIPNSIGGIVKAYKRFLRDTNTPRSVRSEYRNRASLKITGTVKLHGTHIDLVFSVDNNFRIQSRKQLEIPAHKDLHDIVKTLQPLEQQIFELRNKFMQRFEEGVDDDGSKAVIDPDLPIIIAGEWIGSGIQRGVAISQLPKKVFVILGCNINGKWVNDYFYSDIEHENYGFYNIYRGGSFTVNLDVRHGYEKSRDIMTKETLKVEKECPFAKTFGISGPGEGIVWKLEYPFGADSKFWAKTKGPKFAVTRIDEVLENPAQLRGGAGPPALAFARKCVLVPRMEQAWEELELELRPKKMKKVHEMNFLRWLWKDVEEEEKEEIERLMMIGWESLKKEIGIIAKPWFHEKLEAMKKP